MDILWCEFCNYQFILNCPITVEGHESSEFRGGGLLVANIQYSGIIRNYLPHADLELTLEDQAANADLYNKIGKLLGDKLPEAIWDMEKSRFRGCLIGLFSKIKLPASEPLLCRLLD